MAGIAILLVVLPALPVAASNATPTPPDTNPANCTIAPRTLDDLQQIMANATPIPDQQRPPSRESISLQSETGQHVTGVIETLVACLNAGDRLRAYALYTDAYLAGILQPGDLPAIATPDPEDPTDATHIIAIELHAIDGGGVIATVTLDPALIPVHKIFEFILIPIDGQWRIDRVINEIDFSLP